MVQLLRLGGGHGEDLIRVFKGEEHAAEGIHRRAQLLREAEAHQRIPQIDNELGQCHFNQGGTGQHHLQTSQLARAGHVGHGDQQRLEDGQSALGALHAKGKGHGQIAQTDGQAMLHAFEEELVHRGVRLGFLCSCD